MQEYMTNEKEINCNLFDQLTLLERIERVAEAEGCQKVLDVIAFEKKAIERKLYQNPPLTDK